MKSLANIWRNLPLKAKIGVGLFGFFVLAGIIGPMVAPYDPSLQTPLTMAGPSGQHWFGTTQEGQDILSQVLTGIRLTLELALEVGVIVTVVSVLVGVTSAFLGGIWDDVLSLITNVFLVLPPLPLLIVLLGYLSQQGQTPTIIVLSLLGWPWGARVIRAQTLAIRGRDFIDASRETGEKNWRIIVFELIPNEISLIAASFVNTVLYAIGASVALAFVGLTNVNSWSLGTILFWAQTDSALQSAAWWWFVPAGLAVALIGTSLVLLNSGLDELGSPRLRATRGTAKVAGHRIWPTDPTPVLAQLQNSRGRFGSFLYSFSRRSMLEGNAAGGDL
ncbi:MAG TPA: ABC transporter permease [Streptosporangiaceae bacterium]|nr:ABC transporter permease [Streptosporangiaceae bacterium]